jgi:hypothetical protein
MLRLFNFENFKFSSYYILGRFVIGQAQKEFDFTKGFVLADPNPP